MATRPAGRPRKSSGHPCLAPFLADLTEYQRELHERLESDTPLMARTVVALVLKACFLKLAHERQFLSVEQQHVFAELMKLRHREARSAAQLDLWSANRVHLAVDSLLEDLDLSASVVAKARVKRLQEIVFAWRIDLLAPDILGTVYQTLTALDERKRDGQYYTPPFVVGSILDDIDLDPDAKPDLMLLDPACGSGQFLLLAYDRLKAKLLASGLNPGLAHRRILERHLFGFDIDPFALTLTRMNLFLKERITEPVRFRVFRTNPLKREEHRLFCEAAGVSTLIGKFDAVVGNPPWGSDLSDAEREEYRHSYEVGERGLNSFTLFLERALELVKPGGQVGFLLPEALLNVRQHQTARRHLLRRSSISAIATCGELFERVFAPSAILVLRREEDAAKREAARVRVTRALGTPKESACVIEQATFMRTPENIFSLHVDDPTRSLLGKIAENAAGLKGRSRFGLGLVTGDNERFLSPAPLSERHEPVLTGREVERFRLRPPAHYIVFDPEALQQVCPREIFDAPQKLVYRFIGKTLVFALDEEKRLTLNSANVLVPLLPGFRIKYLLALLNSTVLQFYYTMSFFTLKVLKGNLERMPLRYAPEPVQRSIEAKVDALNGLEGEAFAALVSEIDADIMAVYGITPEEERFLRARLAEELGSSSLKERRSETPQTAGSLLP